ncbi:unnamed protein product [Caenorhabditis nigoni]
MVFEREKCTGAEDSFLNGACKTDVINDVIHSGCINRTNWETNFLCSPLHNRRVFKKRFDSSGLFIQDNIKSSCCREPLCNNINYFRLLKNKKGNENNNLDQQLISDAVFLIFCVILSMIIIIAELLYRKPMIGRIEKKSYKKQEKRVE